MSSNNIVDANLNAVDELLEWLQRQNKLSNFASIKSNKSGKLIELLVDFKQPAEVNVYATGDKIDLNIANRYGHVVNSMKRIVLYKTKNIRITMRTGGVPATITTIMEPGNCYGDININVSTITELYIMVSPSLVDIAVISEPSKI